MSQSKSSTVFCKLELHSLSKKTLLKISLHPGLNLTTFSGTGPRRRIRVLCNTTIDNTTGQRSLFLDSNCFFFNSTSALFFDSNFKISTRVFFFVREHIFCKSRLIFFIAFDLFYKFRLKYYVFNMFLLSV